MSRNEDQKRSDDEEQAVPINRGADGLSQRVYALIFNGLTRGLSAAGEFVRLSSREKATEAVYEELRHGGVEVRLEDGLAKLRAVADELAAEERQE